MANRLLYIPAKKNGGILYNWDAIIDARDMAPEGFHVADEEDWANLLGYIVNNAGGALKGFQGWTPPNTGAVNSVAFNCVPSGKRNADGSFVGRKTESYHWIKNINT
jgi:uncharacterized protein (TIGR02145 family)